MTPECEILIQWLQTPCTVVFLSGEAGTGKTYQIRQLLKHWPKPQKPADLPTVAVAAPTGLAAEHIGGQTLHLLLRIPVADLAIEYDPSGLRRLSPYSFPSDQYPDFVPFQQTIKALKLLIIDEISMVSFDLFELIEARLRMIRESDQPFGGLSLLVVGDLHQLPPVKDELLSHKLRSTRHDSVFFFSAYCLKHPAVHLKYMELTEVKRVQRNSRKSAALKDLLQNLRTGHWDDQMRDLLQQRYELARENFYPTPSSKVVTTHNIRAMVINQWMLHYLPGPFQPLYTQYQGTGIQYVGMKPNLLVKVGAPILFTESENTVNKKGKRRYYNGTFGVITQIYNDHLMIAIRQSDGTYREEKITPLRWRLEGDVLKRIPYPSYPYEKDYISQYPIDLAWAITIHKAQGASLDQVFVDAQYAFEPGHLYVAMSRVTSMAGLFPLFKLDHPAIQPDAAVIAFERQMRQWIQEHPEEFQRNPD